MMVIQAETKIIIKADSPLKFKKEVGRLLNELMRDYKVKGKDDDWEKAFKKIFKSNLYYIIDNYFDVKPNKKQPKVKK